MQKCVCVCVRGRWMRSSRMKMMTAKQRRNKTANTTKQFQICSDSVVSRNSPGAEGRAELSFVWAACGATCALRCRICIGVLTEAEVGLAASEPERRGGAELRNRRTGDGPRHPRSKPKSRRAQEDFYRKQQAGKHDHVICVGREHGHTLTAPPRGRSEVQHKFEKHNQMKTCSMLDKN